MKGKTTYIKSERTKQFIIEKAAPIFNKKGYAGASFSDIMEVTGLSKGCIYGNFKNKNEIAIEAFRHNLSLSAYGFSLRTLGSELTPLEKLRKLTVGFREIYEDVMMIGGCPIINTASDTDDTHPQLRKMAQDVVLKIEKGLASVIKEGIAQGEIKKDTDPGKMTKVIFALLEGSFLIARLLDNRQYFDSSLDRILEIINEFSVAPDTEVHVESEQSRTMTAQPDSEKTE
ncbi:MAG: TetR/AcrR family transcriptional regulator [Prevotellaceae bacterium]|jgi:AcrR family transcriptional regulator|nr:TetR/AcrR family transcriptional regulator [Prevotellaceae bacterium]